MTIRPASLAALRSGRSRRARPVLVALVFGAVLSPAGAARAAVPDLGAARGAGSGAGTARLTAVRAQHRGLTSSVVIEASEPVVFVASRPDPFTVLIHMRNVDGSGVTNTIDRAEGLVSGVSVEETVAPDGAPVANVKVSLVTPAAHRVRSAARFIYVDLDGSLSPIEDSLARHTVVGESGGRSKTGGDPPATGAAVVPRSRATALQRVRSTTQGTLVSVILGGNGTLEASSVTEVRGVPHRLILDFDQVLAAAPAQTWVRVGPVQRVRVAQNRRRPLRTRVVLDLDGPTPYRIEPAGESNRDLEIVLGSDPTGLPRAMIGTSGPPANEAPMPGAPLEPIESRPVGTASVRASQPVQGQGQSPTSTPSEPRPAEKPPTAPSAPLASTVSPAPDAALVSTPVEPGSSASSTEVGSPGQSEAALAPGLATQAPSDGIVSAPPPSAHAKGGVPALGLAAAVANRSQTTTVGTQRERQYTGHPVTLDFQGADLRAVLRTFAEISGLNLVIDPAVNGTVDVTLRDVPWDQALDLILRANKLGYVVDGTIVRIAPLTVLADEESQRRKLAEEQALAGALEVITLPLSYARAEELKPLLTRSALTARGEVEVDVRTNTLIIRDLPAALATASDLIGTLDKPQPQVEIEARIVQTNRDFARSIGVQWGIAARAAPELGNTTALAFPNQGSITGRTGGLQGAPNANADTAATAVNLGVSAASSAIGISLGSVNGAVNLDVALSALERSGRGRLLSTPRVSTQNNVEAEVTQGVQIPIQTVANNTVTVTFKDAALTLKVVPQITAAGTVIMKIALENATPDFTKAVNGIPPINTQRANTQVLVNDGQTTVIGGIYVSTETSQNDRTPGLHKVPLLGWLFKRDSLTDESRELLIFITPRIIKS